MVPDPPPNQYISEKPSSRAFRIYPTYPPPQGPQEAQTRQQWHRHPKTLRVGIKPDVPERYSILVRINPCPSNTRRRFHQLLVIYRSLDWGGGEGNGRASLLVSPCVSLFVYVCVCVCVSLFLALQKGA